MENQKKICFVNPGVMWYPDAHFDHAPPYGILSLIAVLEQAGYHTELFDFEFTSVNKIRAKVKEMINVTKKEALFWGVNFTAGMGLKKSIDIVKSIRAEVGSKAKIVGGGPLATVAYDQILKDLPVDIICIGESEVTVLELASALSINGDISTVKGLAFRSNGGIVTTQDREFMKDIQRLPPYPWERIELDRYIFKGSIPLIYSRGCVSRCTFCNASSIAGQMPRSKTPEEVISDLLKFKKQHNLRAFKLVDNIAFGGSKKLFKDFCFRLINLDLGLKWLFWTRVDLIDKEMAELSKRAGCYQVRFGIESGSEKILKKIKKGITLEQIESAFNICRDAGIDCGTVFMTGFPFETAEDLNLTKKLILDCEKRDIYTMVHIVQPYPGTELIEEFKHTRFHLPKNIHGWMRTNDITFFRPPPFLSFCESLRIYRFFYQLNFFRFSSGLSFYQNLNMYRMLLERYFYKRSLQIKKAFKLKLSYFSKKRPGKHPYNFPFTEKDTPEIRKIVTKDLDRIVRYLAKVYPDSEIGIWGSFSHGEGRIDASKNPPVYYSDFDMVVITPSFFKFVLDKIKGAKTIRDKLCIREKRLYVDLAVLWRPFLEFSLPNGVPVNQLLFGKGDGKMLATRSLDLKWLGVSYILGACTKATIALSKNNIDSQLLAKSFIACLKALLFKHRTDVGILSLGIAEKILHEYKNIALTEEQTEIIKNAMAYRRDRRVFDFGKKEFYAMIPLFRSLLRHYKGRWSWLHLGFMIRFYGNLRKGLYSHIKLKFSLNPVNALLDYYDRYFSSLQEINTKE